MRLDECDNHFKAIRESSSPEDLRFHFRALLDAYYVLSFKLGRASVFWRGRRTGVEPYISVSQMSYPPPEYATAGRLNEKGLPCLYAATRRTTALAELDLMEGARVQLIGFRIKPDHNLRIGAIGELFHIHKTGYTKSLGVDPENALSRIINAEGLENGSCLVYIDAFLGSLFADQHAGEMNYIATQVLATMAYQKSGADGFFYPSVRDHVGMNVAILPGPFDSQTHVVCSQFIEITKVREFGFYDYNVLLEATAISEAGDIAWRQPKVENGTTFFNLTKRERDFFTGKTSSDGNTYLEFIKLEQNGR